MSMRVVKYVESQTKIWDEFIEYCPMGTFLHTRRFLAYHGDKFVDSSFMIYDSKNKLIGLFPAAQDLDEEKTVVNHPGLTYGGILHKGELSGQKMLCAFDLLIKELRKSHVNKLIYKSVPYVYHLQPSDDDLYALFFNGAKLYRCDLGCAINLHEKIKPSKGKKHSIKKARRSNIIVKDVAEDIDVFWNMLVESLDTKYSTKPVHTVIEIKLLKEYFPNNIKFKGAYYENSLVAGVALFLVKGIVHVQYIAVSDIGREHSALDLLISECINEALELNYSYFDFGSSTEKQGRYLNQNLHSFKANFGGGGVIHQFYEVSI